MTPQFSLSSDYAIDTPHPARFYVACIVNAPILPLHLVPLAAEPDWTAWKIDTQQKARSLVDTNELSTLQTVMRLICFERRRCLSLASLMIGHLARIVSLERS